MEPVWPFALYCAAVIAVVGAMIGLSALLGQRHSETSTGEPYESGILSTGSARVRLSVKFYLVAVCFVIFDVEAVFLFAWAIALDDVGWTGFVEILIFVGVLIAALVYLWRLGALDWGPLGRRPTRSPEAG
ncbi:MAG: NADH-quinone oxidoreductase subunit A [Candidatus Methylomirabilota bacterium]|nr:NADH-quinone oxidoreductase subunit A [candidate division NC10 bacterium]PWB46427.1 MAG: NADH-quinone oxidoreductase subunit A [candidate division NC10 bacterium]